MKIPPFDAELAANVVAVSVFVQVIASVVVILAAVVVGALTGGRGVRRCGHEHCASAPAVDTETVSIAQPPDFPDSVTVPGECQVERFITGSLTTVQRLGVLLVGVGLSAGAASAMLSVIAGPLPGVGVARLLVIPAVGCACGVGTAVWAGSVRDRRGERARRGCGSPSWEWGLQ